MRQIPNAAATAWLVWLAMTDTVVGVGGAIIECKVIGRVEHRPVIMLDVGRHQGIALGDRAVLLTNGRMAGTGRVFYIEPGLCGVRLGCPGPRAARPDAAVVVSRALPGVCRIALPAGTTVSARVDDVAPGHRAAWLDQGRNAGLLLGDGLLVVRTSGPIARAEVVELYENEALVRLERLVPGAPVRSGDWARLWPSPGERRSGRIGAPVLAVESSGTEQHIWLAGGAAEGLLLDRRVELLRGSAYIAAAVIDQSGPILTRATTVEAYARQPASTGDRATLLDPPAGGDGPVGRIFRIDGNYCLISAGEDVGIRRGQRLYAARLGGVVATLTVKTVKETYCGADIDQTPGQAGENGGPRVWDRVLSQPPQTRSVQNVGRIDQISPDGLFATVPKLGDSQQPECGTLVSIVRQNGTSAAAIIVHKANTHTVLHTPPCWRGDPISPEAQVLYRQDLQKPDK